MFRRSLLSLVAAAVLAVSGVSAAAAASPDGGAPGVVPLAQVGKGLTREVYGFLNTGQVDWALTHLDYSVLSSIAFFGIRAGSDGHLIHDARWTVWSGSKVTELINRAHSHGTRFLLTVTGFAWTSGQRTAMAALLGSSARRHQLAVETAAAVVQRGADGVNLDFEPIPSGYKAGYTALVREVRAALTAQRRGLGLTFDVTGYMDSYDVAGLTAQGAANAMFIMGYHYRGSWSTTAGSIAPLTRPGYDVTDTVDTALRYTTPDKVILGVPYYGYSWSTTGSGVRSAVRPSGSIYGWPSSVLYSRAVALASAHGRLWDSVEQSPWTRYLYRACSSCPLTWRQVYYDDAISLGRKYDLVNRKGLRGAGIWALGYEGDRTELNATLRSHFGAP